MVQWFLRLTFGTFISGWLFLCGFRLLDDISIEVLIQDRIVCNIRCCIPLSFSEYHILGAVKRPGQWVVYEVLLSPYAVPNEYTGSCSLMQLLSFLFWNLDKSQAFEQTEMIQRWPLSGSMPGLVLSITNHCACRSAVLEIDHQ
jgi:hypothetical protein